VAGGYDSYLTLTSTGFAVDDRCYSTAGTATLNASTIDFGQAHDTRTIPCTSPMNEEQAVDQQVDSTLSGSAEWALNGETLTITKGDSTLTYTSVPGGSPTS
jgi:heat shock protein HslJ